MAYTELIKNFERIRDYMREFYVYGFKSRDEYDKKSARSYDNERRRIESYLGEYMGFRQSEKGKNVFLSIDSRSVSHNPLYSVLKSKSFTDGDITLHFIIFDILYSTEVDGIESVTIIGDAFADNTREVLESTEHITLELLDHRNALERVMLHFAHFKKEAEKISDERYRIKIFYDSSDETELVIRVLSFGPFVEVTEPQNFRNLIIDRLKRQKNIQNKEL